MSDTSRQSPSSGRMPSDTAMDQLLRQFFQREMPRELQSLTAAGLSSPAAGRDNLPWVAATPERQSLMLPAAPTQPARSNSAARGIAVVGTLAALTACLTFIATSDLSARSGLSGSAAARSVPAVAPGSDSDDKLLLVSPQAHSSDAAQTPIGNNGVTLEETEGVDLQPQR